MQVLTELKKKYPQSYLLEYIDQTQSGEIIIGQEIKLCLDNLLNDLQNDQYQFDMTEPHKRIKFIQEKCHHSIAPFGGKSFLLALWQKCLMEAIYGFKIYDEESGQWIRRFTDVLLLIARKNGKSSMAAAIALCEFFVGDLGTNVMCASNSYDQAAILFDECANMREQSPSLVKVSRKNIQGIFMGGLKQKSKRGKFSRQNKAKIRKLSGRTSAKEGRNLDLAVIDEVHEMADSSLVSPMKQSMSTKSAPLLLEITTEGFIEGYLDQRLNYARRILKGEVVNKRFLSFLYTQDTEEEVFQSKDSWYKSNPNLMVSKKRPYLEGIIEEAKTETATRAYMMSKDFNFKQNSATAWLTDADIINTATVAPEQFKGKYYIGALDFAETTDLCNAKALFYDHDSGQTYTLTMYFIPESKADAMLEDDNKTNPEKKDYRKWAREGLVTICPGDKVDPVIVVKWFYSLYENYKMTPYMCGFDNWHSTGLKNSFVEHFGEGILERINMDFSSLSNPMRLLESALKNKILNYNNNPIDLWNLRNVSIKMDATGRIMPIKKYGQSKNRIDGALGFIIAFAVYSRYKNEFMARR